MPDRRTLAVMLAGFCAFVDVYATQPILPVLAERFKDAGAVVVVSRGDPGETLAKLGDVSALTVLFQQDYEDGRRTSNFAGMIAVIQPQLSWVCRYKGLGKTPGIYAVDARPEILLVREQELDVEEDEVT